MPFRYLLVFLYCLFGLGAWRAGRVGVMWARLRSDVYRMRDYKLAEMKLQNASCAADTTKNRTEQVA